METIEMRIAKEMGRLLTVKEIAHRLSVSKRTVYGYISSGLLLPTHLPPVSNPSGEGRIRITEAELARFIDHLR